MQRLHSKNREMARFGLLLCVMLFAIIPISCVRRSSSVQAKADTAFVMLEGASVYSQPKPSKAELTVVSMNLPDYGELDLSYELIEGMATLKDYVSNVGMVVLCVGPDRASDSLLCDLVSHSDRLKLWGGMLYVVSVSGSRALQVDLPNADIEALPPAGHSRLLAMAIQAAQLKEDSAPPVILLVDPEGHIRFRATSYRRDMVSALLQSIAVLGSVSA